MIEEYIPKGYKKRVSRGYLQEMSGMSDRDIRSEIADAQSRGIMIASVDGGYFQRKDEKDDPYIAEYYAKEKHRLNAQRRKLRALHKAWMGVDEGQVPGQMEMDL